MLSKNSLVEVHKVTSLKDGKRYVLKQLTLTDVTERQKSDAYNEAAIMERIKHPNIVTYITSFEEDNKLNILMELCENMDLATFIDK